jgi:inner membrane protein
MDSFTQIALGIAIAEVCAGKNLKNNFIRFYFRHDSRFRCCSWSLLDPVNAVLIHRGISHSLFLFYFFIPGWITKLETGLTSQVHLLGMFSWGTQILWPLDYRFALKNNLC